MVFTVDLTTIVLISVEYNIICTCVLIKGDIILKLGKIILQEAFHTYLWPFGRISRGSLMLS